MSATVARTHTHHIQGPVQQEMTSQEQLSRVVTYENRLQTLPNNSACLSAIYSLQDVCVLSTWNCSFVKIIAKRAILFQASFTNARQVALKMQWRRIWGQLCQSLYQTTGRTIKTSDHLARCSQDNVKVNNESSVWNSVPKSGSKPQVLGLEEEQGDLAELSEIASERVEATLFAC